MSKEYFMKKLEPHFGAQAEPLAVALVELSDRISDMELEIKLNILEKAENDTDSN